MRFSLPPIADHAVLFLWRLASVAAYASMTSDRRRYGKAREVRSRGGAGIRVHAVDDGCWSFAAGQQPSSTARSLRWMPRVEQQHAYGGRLVINTATRWSR